MTLKELSPLYLESARLISERMSLLRRQRRETDDPRSGSGWSGGFWSCARC